MTQQSLMDFDKSITFPTFESEWIRQFSMEEEKIFSFKNHLSIQAKPNVKKKKLVYLLLIETFFKDEDDVVENFWDSQEFKTKELAIEQLENKKDELIWFLDKDKSENKIFDGRRYMIKLDDDENIVGRGWM